MITNDAFLFGLLAIILGGIFYTASIKTPFWQKFYTYIPMVLMCYFVPSLINTFGLVDGENSKLYFVASRYLLPACLVMLTLSVDFKRIVALGPKALIMFLTGTVGVVIGGPIAILIFSVIDPSVVGGHGPESVWRAMTTVAGSWIGGGANQAAMKEVFQVSDRMFSIMVTVDILVAEVWMAALLIMAARHREIDRKNGADVGAIDDLRKNVEAFQKEHARIPMAKDLMIIFALGFGVMGLAHFGADNLSAMFKNIPGYETSNFSSQFFWLVVIATTAGLLLSFTPAKKLEGVGASSIGTIFIFILVATIGLKMDIMAIFEHLSMFLVGAVWMLVHVALLFIVRRIIKAPIFFLAVGSKANIGGAASAPVLAAAFHPSLAPVGVLLAVLGYILGTYAALFTGTLMEMVAPM
ncbi:DUF819 domain-containing protein [Paremcibacter congregatus]|uniref:DUF819 domain-containing protein n=1 Tax=Paremcibacter congregatus TaxID=2043170 RepID=A0A2G4YUN1_9PROT|nr:DUF819 family protein [Paremcibacter congregatus]PHZ85977.1 hypothetical protein CRD36_04710 [Paremcibacter congregatus]QDE26943.1 DUF819 family protein [Paremcibacter congregatus]|tara:strand:+ start:841 stop:2073 length:1233 start_codon:yes stop_codon:yes gene_type:complete